MKNNKGQALVEFVLVIPILIIMIFGMVELGNLIHKKYLLETYMDTAISLYKDDKKEVIDSYATTNNISINFTETGSIVSIEVSEKVKLITPGINIVLENPYTLTAHQSFYINRDNQISDLEGQVED